MIHDAHDISSLPANSARELADLTLRGLVVHPSSRRLCQDLILSIIDLSNVRRVSMTYTCYSRRLMDILVAYNKRNAA
jgi:hypothetical protein